MILANFYINNASHIDNQSAKWRLNLSMETTVIAACELASKREVSSIRQLFVES